MSFRFTSSRIFSYNVFKLNCSYRHGQLIFLNTYCSFSAQREISEGCSRAYVAYRVSFVVKSLGQGRCTLRKAVVRAEGHVVTPTASYFKLPSNFAQHKEEPWHLTLRTAPASGSMKPTSANRNCITYTNKIKITRSSQTKKKGYTYNIEHVRLSLDRIYYMQGKFHLEI